MQMMISRNILRVLCQIMINFILCSVFCCLCAANDLEMLQSVLGQRCCSYMTSLGYKT